MAAWPMMIVKAGVIGKATRVGMMMGMEMFPWKMTVKALFYGLKVSDETAWHCGD